MSRTLFKTQPHHGQQVKLILDRPDPSLRVYQINATGNSVVLTGEEMQSLAGWWGREQKRKP